MIPHTLVKKRRECLGWSQSDLARAMGSSPSRVCKMEAGDESVSEALILKALETMAMDLHFETAEGKDLTVGEMRAFSTRLLRCCRAKVIAEKESVDPGDVEHVLHNLTLTPGERLKKSFKRAGLKRYSTH